MPTPKPDRLLSRGIWLLVVGVFTSWLLGLGLLFIAAAAVCGFIGLFGKRFVHSSILLASALVLGFVCTVVALHVTALAGIYAYNNIKANGSSSAQLALPPAQQHK